MIRWLFHAGCAVVLATSVVLALWGAPTRVTNQDPREQLARFMISRGFERQGVKEILSGETLYTFARAGCTEPVTVFYLPVIHRISDVSQDLIGRRASIFVHDGAIVPDPAGTTLIPRWLWRRLLVNFQALDEDPWISIALAVQDPAGCLPKDIDWRALPSS